MHPTGMSRTILGQLARQRGLDPFSYLCNTAANADHSQQTDMTISKRIAGLLGPTLMAVLASDAASYVTGAVWAVDGGITAI